MTSGVYLLMDPRSGDVKYVGQSRRIEHRVKVHSSLGFIGTWRWVKELRDAGFRPFWDCVEESDQARMDEIERQLIRDNQSTVFNIASGGRAGFHYLRPTHIVVTRSSQEYASIISEEEFRRRCTQALAAASVPAEKHAELISGFVTIWRRKAATDI